MIRRGNNNDMKEWLRMRMELWPHCPQNEQIDEISKIIINEPIGDEILTDILVLDLGERELGGFVEVSLRKELEGFDTSPIGYVEGWFIDDDIRRKGYGKDLIKGAEEWAREKGCKEMASDAELDNIISINAHGRLGYKEYGRNDEEVLFKKSLYIL